MFFKNPFKKTTFKAYWWAEVPNFGDALAPLLLEHFAEIKVEWGSISHSSIASIGSILEHIPPLWDGYILGSGRLMPDSRLHLVQRRTGVSAKILSVRGPLTARGIPGSFGIGDPGILADELVGFQEKQWDLGILPHWQDTELAPRFKKMIPEKFSIHVINPSDDPLDVVRQIGASRRLVTSSLHGMIVADGFGVPRRVETCPAMARDGGDFKFRDYCASVQMKFETGKMMEPVRFRVEDVKFQVYDAYRALGKALK
jgi:pyruvyltransferase